MESHSQSPTRCLLELKVLQIKKEFGTVCASQLKFIDASSPEGRAKSLGEDYVERIVLISSHWGKHNRTSIDA